MVHNPVFIASIGGVLAGSIFGDHCSPISDTTILSSRASGCDHMAHVWTQMPYALLVAVVSIVAGTIPVGFGVSVWVCLPVSALLLLGLLWCLAHRDDEDSAPGGLGASAD
jgi:Na+/H+ antiporter NhaC